jgi:tetratricopeptide (TPR) repeat protein
MVGNTLDGQSCSNFPSKGFGPFDYTKRLLFKKELHLVEMRHFTKDVQYLIKGSTTSAPPGDLDYTLRAWPNHHKALLSMIRYQLRSKNGFNTEKLKTPPECYLQRAIHFNPNDANVYALYAYYLKKLGLLKQAEKQYKKALAIDPNNAKIEYSFSLFLIETGKYPEALKFAKLAYQHNKKTPNGLRKKLKKLGVWK